MHSAPSLHWTCGLQHCFQACFIRVPLVLSTCRAALVLGACCALSTIAELGAWRAAHVLGTCRLSAALVHGVYHWFWATCVQHWFRGTCRASESFTHFSAKFLASRRGLGNHYSNPFVFRICWVPWPARSLAFIRQLLLTCTR